MLEIQLHFISAIVILLAALVPIYLTIRLKDNLRKLVAILSLFILTHSVYHILGFLGLTLLAEGVFEPLSVAVLIIFGFVYFGIAKPKNMSIKNMVVAWNPATLLILMNSITTMLLLIALGMFVWLAVRSKNIKTFQFQISIFIIIWISGEIAGILQDSGIIVLSPVQGDIGLEIHVVSMVFFSMMLWLRYYYSERSGKKMIEDITDVSR
ncbi:MAG TPA: hypothetical protein VEL70_07745 [Candidatus Acidoferrum sp.]|nr:hypothetical protein [Candidatus Acidoferrum sp.]